VRAVAAWLSIIMLMTSTRSLLLVQNPYITDAMGLSWMAVMLAGLLGNWPVRFGGAGVIGVLTREDALFGAFGFVASRRGRAGVMILLAAVTAFLVPRLGHPAVAQFVGIGQLLHWQYYAKVYVAFGFVWGLSVLGLWLAPRRELRLLLPYSACAFGGALLSTLFAVDTTRVFLPVLPLAAVATALVMDRLVQRPWLILAWQVEAAANVVLAMPNVAFAGSGAQTNDLEAWYAELAIPIALHQIVGLVLLVLTVRGLLRRVAPSSPTNDRAGTPTRSSNLGSGR
jgi:hypothetical protein